MVRWAMIFLALAGLAAILGFSGLAGAASTLMQVLFAAFFFAALATLVLRHSLPNS